MKGRVLNENSGRAGLYLDLIVSALNLHARSPRLHLPMDMTRGLHGLGHSRASRAWNLRCTAVSLGLSAGPHDPAIIELIRIDIVIYI